MQPILIDGGELVLERLVEVLDDLVVALHRGLLKHRAEKWEPVFRDNDASTNTLCAVLITRDVAKSTAENGGKLRKIRPFSCFC